MPTDYATLMEASRAQRGVTDPRDSTMTSAMRHFQTTWMHQDALTCVLDALARKAALRAAVATRYPDFDAIAMKGRVEPAHHEPLLMASFVDFVLCHEDCCRDPSLRRAVFRAIADEAEAVLATAPDSARMPGGIDFGDGCFDRASLAAGLAWLRDRIAEREAAG